MRTSILLLLVGVVAVGSGCIGQPTQQPLSTPNVSAIALPTSTMTSLAAPIPTATSTATTTSTGLPTPVKATDNHPAFAFQGNRAVHVAWLDEDNIWQVQSLPEALLFEQWDVDLITPRWAGDVLYMTGFSPSTTWEMIDSGASPSRAGTIYRYDLATHQFTVAVETFLPAGEGANTPKIASISPDGRYLWLTQTWTWDSYLVDVQTRQRRAWIPCLSTVLGWLKDAVLVAETPAAMKCNPAIDKLNLETGSITTLTRPPADYPDNVWNDAAWTGQVLRDGLLLTGTVGEAPGPGVVDLLSLESDGPTLRVDHGWEATTSQSQRYLAYENLTNHLMWFDRISGQKLDLGPSIKPSYWIGETLYFWQKDMARGVCTIYAAQVTDGMIKQHAVYQGPEPSWVTLPPFGQDFAAIEFETVDGRAAYVQAIGPEGIQWDSRDQFPDSSVTLTRGSTPEWTPDGQWLHLNNVDMADDRRTLSVNMVTGKTVLSSEPGALLSSQSPDGMWWLYVITDYAPDAPDPQNFYDRIILYNQTTGNWVVLIDDVWLDQDEHWKPEGFFVWKP